MTIEKGRTVFGRDGRSGEYVAKLDHGHLVRPLAEFTRWDGETSIELTDALEIWSDAFPKAPRFVVSDEIAALREEEGALRKQIQELRVNISETQREHIDIFKRLKRFEPLKYLEEALNGSITHVVEIEGGCPVIKTLADALPYRDDYDRKDKLRFLTLAPTEDGVISWHLTRYAGGTGDRKRAYLCTSHDEARETVRQMLVAEFEDSADWRQPAVVECAAKSGVELPPEYVERAAEFRRQRAQQAVGEAAKKLAEAEAALTSLAGAPQ